MIDDLYYDCAPSRGIVSSSYTPYGIRGIDSEYTNRIKNINKPVLRLIHVKRTHHYEKEGYKSDYWDDYIDKPLDEDFKSYDRTFFQHSSESPFREWNVDENMQRAIDKGLPYEKFYISGVIYTNTKPTYSAKHKGEDPEVLKKEIEDNPHLHKKIKGNLLDNLKYMLENER